MSHRRLPSRASSDIDGSSSFRKQPSPEAEAMVELSDISSPTRQHSLNTPLTNNLSPTDAVHPGSQFCPPRGLIAHKRTILQIILTFLPRWLLTFAIAASIFGTLSYYASLDVMSQASKRGFNAIITGLSILQGLVVVASLNRMVGDMRWWVLSRRFRSRRKVERILRAESLLHLVALARKSKRPMIYMTVVFWSVVLLGTQVAVASLNLFYSTGAAEGYPLMVKGDIEVADMSTIYTDKVVASNKRALGAQQYTANSYGTISTAYNIVVGQEYVPAPGTIFWIGEPFIYWSPDEHTYLYVFRETSVKSLVKDGIWAVAVTTDRTVEASAQCNSYNVTAGGKGDQLSLLIDDKGREDRNVTIPFAGGTDQTTYFTNTTQDCGTGCSPVLAFESTEKGAWYYECNVTVGAVTNVTRPEHEVGEEVAMLASSAIALQGYGVSSLAKDNITQFQSYPLESIFGSTANGNTAEMGDLLSRFTIGVIAAVAETNNKTTIRNVQAPEAGISMTVSRPVFVFMILVGVVGLQLVLEILVAIFSNQVVQPPRGVVATAQVLRAMTLDEESLWPGESSLLARKLGKRPDGGRGLWRYVVTPIEGKDVFDLGMEKAPE